MNSSTKI
nr:TetA' [Cloning vector pBBR-IBA3plus]ABN58907.1 TetA fragment [Expression vector pASHSUL]ABN58911.1 TetA fragment [Expression vector pASS2SUL]BAG71040.1 tetracycline efflux protein [synthetic construct]